MWVKPSMRSCSLVVAALFVLFTAGIAAERRAPSRSGSEPTIFKYQLNLARLATRSSDAVEPTVWTIKVTDVVAYVADVPYDQLQSTMERTLTVPKPGTSIYAIGDIREINGRAVKGMYVARPAALFSTPTPSPETGIAIADSTRIAQFDQSLDIQTEDGTQIGGIFSLGLAFGEPAPGAPSGSGGNSMAIVGGSGPYIAMQGQLQTDLETSPFADPPGVRFASAAENPAVRRVNGGGTTGLVAYLLPRFVPQLLYLTGDLGAVFHASDQALVTQQDPAIPGEVLTALMKNLGPTRPGVDPGEPFPRDPLNVVNSPVEVLVNGEPATVSFAGGEPAATNVYEVEFVVPESAPSGRATVQIHCAFIAGVPFEIFVD